MKISDDELLKEALCQVYRGVQNAYLTAQKHEERLKKIVFSFRKWSNTQYSYHNVTSCYQTQMIQGVKSLYCGN